MKALQVAFCLAGVALSLIEVTESNFKDVVLERQGDVLLEVYSPWCPHW